MVKQNIAAKTELMRLATGPCAVRVNARTHYSEDEPVLAPSVAEYRVYDASIYDFLTGDEARNRLYERAIRKYAPGGIALDIGTGRDVNWARAAIEAGARKAYAIEEMDFAYTGAQATIARLGLQDRIHLIRGNSTNIELPEKVDLCVSEIIGAPGSAEGAPAVLRDARRRHMAPGAKMIPERCQSLVVALTLPDSLHNQPALAYSWTASYLERVFAQVGHPFDIRLSIEHLPESSMLSAPGVLEDFDFTGDVPVTSVQHTKLQITHGGRLDGFWVKSLLWCLKDDEPYDTHNDGDSFVPLFFPAFYPGIQVAPGDVIEMVCEVDPSDHGVLPDYRMNGELIQPSGITPFTFESAYKKPLFRCNPFYRALFPLDGSGT